MRVHDAKNVCMLLDCDGDMMPAQYYAPSEVKATVVGVIGQQGCRRKPCKALMWRYQPRFAKRLFLLLKPHECENE